MKHPQKLLKEIAMKQNVIKNSFLSKTTKNILFICFQAPTDFHLNSTSSRNSIMTQRLKITENLLADLIKNSDAWPFFKPVTKREV
jgi:hypothetical protein